MSIQNNTSVELCNLSDTPGNIIDSYHWILYMIFFPHLDCIYDLLTKLDIIT